MTIRIGALAASRIATKALIAPAADTDGVEVAAVGARTAAAAEAAATQWGVDRWHGSYEALLADPDIDAVYIATPAALHRRWTLAALDAGKHVLVEKPLAANALDGATMAEAAAARPDLVAMEAFHWRYHPFFDAVAAIVNGGDLGELQSVSSRFNLVTGQIGPNDIRWDLALGGGATMDLGTYPIQWVRFVAGAEPTVVSAEATCPVPDVDGHLVAQLEWPDGLTGSVESSMIAPPGEERIDLTVVGSEATMVVTNPIQPGNGATIEITAAGSTTVTDVETIVNPNLSTYHYQLAAFGDAIENGSAFPTTLADGVTNMAVVDECYRAAGLEPRPTSDGA